MNKIQARILYDDIRGSDSRGGLYVWVDPSDSSVLQIQKLMKGAPFKLRDTTEYHTTVLYHQGVLPHGVKVPIDRECKADITKLLIWEDHKGRLICVASLYSPDLQALHQELLGEGLTHSFPTFEAHMSVGKDLKMDAKTRLWVDGRNEYLKVCPIPIVFDRNLKAASLA